jgi:hypothetical protein
MALFKFATAAAMTGVVATKFRRLASVGIRYSHVVMVAIRTVHVRLRFNGLGIRFGRWHVLTPGVFCLIIR